MKLYANDTLIGKKGLLFIFHMFSIQLVMKSFKLSSSAIFILFFKYHFFFAELLNLNNL